MICPKCKRELQDDNSDFCNFCGKNLKKYRLKLYKENQHKEKQASNKKPIVILLIILAAVLILMGSLFFFFRFFFNTKNDVALKPTSTEIAEMSESVLTLYTYDSKHDPIATGSGFIVGNDSTLITNYHVIEEAYEVIATTENNISYNVIEIGYYDKERDIAIVRLDSPTQLPVLEIADSDSAKVGEKVYSIGSPLGLSNTVSDGLISAIRENNGVPELQITAPISHGSSGGVLLNEYGKVIGMTYASMSDGQNLNFAIPSNLFEPHLDENNHYLFTDLMDFSERLGNTINHYVNNAHCVEYNNRIYANYTGDTIIEYNTSTDSYENIGYKGHYFSAFEGKLYYITDGFSIRSYDFATKQEEKIISIEPKDGEIVALFVTRDGLFIQVCEQDNNDYSSFSRYDFNGNLLSSTTIFCGSVKPINENSFILLQTDQRKLSLLDSKNLQSTNAWTVDFDFENDLILDENGYVYLLPITDGFSQVVVILDLINNEEWTLNIPENHSKRISLCENQILYAVEEGTRSVFTNGSNDHLIISKYILGNPCMISTGIVFSEASLSPSAYNGDYMHDYQSNHVILDQNWKIFKFFKD